uniref:Putative product n=1 Tax=Xenopsylla cheopis TaxID=163159 RepID=A0A6M2DY22_XENCH
MLTSKLEDAVIKVAAAFSIFQSIIWLILSLTGLLAHSCLIPATTIEKNALATILHYQYFREAECDAILDPSQMPTIKDLSTPEDIYLWMWFYFFISFFWFISSLLLSGKTRFNNMRKTIVLTWVAITSIVCLMDFILCVYFAKDYNHIQDFQLFNSVMGGKPLAMQTAAGIMMAIALRGFVLWFINLFFATYIGKITILPTKPLKLNLQGNTQIYDNVSIDVDTYEARKSKEIPKTQTASTPGWAPLHELLRRYKIHSPNIKDRTPTSPVFFNKGFETKPAYQNPYKGRNMYEDRSRF